MLTLISKLLRNIKCGGITTYINIKRGWKDLLQIFYLWKVLFLNPYSDYYYRLAFWHNHPPIYQDGYVPVWKATQTFLDDLALTEESQSLTNLEQQVKDCYYCEDEIIGFYYWG